MNETIDPSEWMHASFNRTYPLQMGRVQERNGRYYVVMPESLFDYLYGANIFTPSHLSAAEFFHSLNEVATSKTGYAKMIHVLENMGISLGGDKIPGFCPTTLMLIISQNMEPWEYAMVRRICTQEVRRNDLAWIEHYKHSVTQTFHKLGGIIELSIDIMKKRLKDGNNYEGRNAPKI